MRTVDLILKKRHGERFSTAEINEIIKGYVDGSIPDYQISALLMAICFQGLDEEETHALTMAMVHSGIELDLSSVPGTTVDKHSTGGVGDTTSLVLIPLVAACGAHVAKMTGPGLGHTGGTVDKLESIPGLTTALTRDEFFQNVSIIGCALMSATADFAPADKRLYALRDVTGTVDSIPLIASSIMSKKLAAGARGIVLDVKVGAGAFMPDIQNARALAERMIDIGRRAGRNVAAVLSDMSQPLGFAVGNALEVKEAIATLQGRGPSDLTELCLTMGTEMLRMGGVAKDYDDAREKLTSALRSGRGWDKFKQLVAAQHGDVSAVEHPERLPEAPIKHEVRARTSGYISSLNALAVGQTSMLLGAGRATKADKIDLSAGVVLSHKIGDYVEAGEVLAVLHTSKAEAVAEAVSLFESAYSFSGTPVAAPKLIEEVLG